MPAFDADCCSGGTDVVAWTRATLKAGKMERVVERESH